MNSSDSRYFLYLYPFLAKKPWIMGQFSYSGHSAQVSRFFSIRQQRFMAQRAARRSRFPSSYPSLQPLQVLSRSARHVPQYAPQQPMEEVSGGGMCMNSKFLPLVQSIDRMVVKSGNRQSIITANLTVSIVTIKITEQEHPLLKQNPIKTI